ncbi:NADPH-dependent FMN reductase [Oceanobacillus chungangensis]|uniref:NADH-dependent FMN reductase n=1 Tax=Oceanobacillus chungangensis TaxID=1229152 RepID=A0A3D8Q015_9BACI|nr:NADPH-dependent FMN reductase [Oceanobacillus chungangensis]RDW20941.1 NADH-dependent FMN reductase [Oceanobacillus chungangensis]
MKLVGISGALAGDKTSLAVNNVLVAAGRLDSSIKTELIDLREYDVEFSVGAPIALYNDDTMDVVKKILSADFLVFGTPIYQASISGALKNLLDLLPENAFKYKVTGIVATGWTNKHFLVPEYQLKPVLSYFKGLIPTGNVYIHNNAFNEDSDVIIDQEISERIEKLAEEMIYLQRGINNR